MKAITIRQPFAALIMLGFKPFEYRSRKPPAYLIGERIAIHAAKKEPAPHKIDWILKDFENKGSRGYRLTGGADRHLRTWLNEAHNEGLSLPPGAVLGAALLQDCNPLEFDLAINIKTPNEHLNGPVHAWELTNTIAFATPIPACGAQGFWNWNESGR